MAIDTNDEKLSLMEWDQIWEPGLPLDEASGFDQGDKQQLIWGYPGISWSAEVEPTGVIIQGLDAISGKMVRIHGWYLEV